MGAIKTETLIVAGVALAVVYLVYQVKDAAGDEINNLWTGAKDIVTNKLNPASDQNLAYTGVNAVGAALSGNPNFDLGVATYDATHGGALDVTSSNNLAASSVNTVGGWLTGNSKFDLGTAIYDWTH